MQIIMCNIGHLCRVSGRFVEVGLQLKGTSLYIRKNTAQNVVANESILLVVFHTEEEEEYSIQ